MLQHVQNMNWLLLIAIYNLTTGMHIPLYSFVVERVLIIWMVYCSKEQRP